MAIIPGWWSAIPEPPPPRPSSGPSCCAMDLTPWSSGSAQPIRREWRAAISSGVETSRRTHVHDDCALDVSVAKSGERRLRGCAIEVLDLVDAFRTQVSQRVLGAEEQLSLEHHHLGLHRKTAHT